jgi:transcriptional regulator with XRE-family HTH domain
MGAQTLQRSSLPEETAVLNKAVTRAAGLLGLTQRQVAEILGLSGPTASRLFTGKYRLSPTRAKEWELAILFVRLFRSLDGAWRRAAGADQERRRAGAGR